MRGSTQLPCRWGRWVVVGALAVVVAGCSRQHFRERADKDVEGVISQKNVFPDWKVENWHVYPDPRARFADAPGSHPDFPPYPPDDYAAWPSSPNPQHPGRGGAGRYEGKGYLDCIAAWDAQNRAEDAAEEQREKEQQKGTADRRGPAGTKTARRRTKPDGAPKGSPDPTAKDDSPGPELAAVAGGAASYLRVVRQPGPAVPHPARPGRRTGHLQQPRVPGPPRRPVPVRPAGHAGAVRVRRPGVRRRADHPRVHRPRRARRRRRVLADQHRRRVHPPVRHRGRAARPARQPDRHRPVRRQPADEHLEPEPDVRPAAAARRRVRRHPGGADPGRADAAVRDPVVRPVPQGVLRCHRRARGTTRTTPTGSRGSRRTSAAASGPT